MHYYGLDYMLTADSLDACKAWQCGHSMLKSKKLHLVLGVWGWVCVGVWVCVCRLRGMHQGVQNCSVPDFCQLLILVDELTLNVLCRHLVDIQLAVKLIQRLLMPECKARLCA